ncbi:MAG: hypothetical protein H6713_14815 [Myxococcales bacterium]|nr:hypothetical protein [Myxococcales bacterium]MCB9751245.1 hypothetical protein [Myxococcales bacterium]
MIAIARLCRTIAAAFALALLVSCGGGPDQESTQGCPAGSEGCPCEVGDACDAGLLCDAGTCVADTSTTSATTAGTASTGGTTAPELCLDALSYPEALDWAKGFCCGDGGAPVPEIRTGVCLEGAVFIEVDGDTYYFGPEPYELLAVHRAGECCPACFECTETTVSTALCAEVICPEPCFIHAQDCPAGAKCAAVDTNGNGAWDSALCVEIKGDGQLGDPCTYDGPAAGTDDCGGGLMCWFYDLETYAGTCVALCEGFENPLCGAETVCSVSNGESLKLCLPTCDPLADDCPQHGVCVQTPMSGLFSCTLDSSGDAGAEGTPCGLVNGCAPGSACISTNDYPAPGCDGEPRCCAPYCDLNNGDADCLGVTLPDATCVSWYGMLEPPMGLEHVGYCAPP